MSAVVTRTVYFPYARSDNVLVTLRQHVPMGMRTRSGAALCAAVVITAVTPLRAVAAPADDPEPVSSGLSVSWHSLYVVDPAAHAVHVSVDTTITNTRPPQDTRFFSFDTFSLPVLSEATNLAAPRDEGTPLTVSTAPTPSTIIAVAHIDL